LLSYKTSLFLNGLIFETAGIPPMGTVGYSPPKIGDLSQNSDLKINVRSFMRRHVYRCWDLSKFMDMDLVLIDYNYVNTLVL